MLPEPFFCGQLVICLFQFKQPEAELITLHSLAGLCVNAFGHRIHPFPAHARPASRMLRLLDLVVAAESVISTPLKPSRQAFTHFSLWLSWYSKQRGWMHARLADVSTQMRDSQAAGLPFSLSACIGVNRALGQQLALDSPPEGTKMESRHLYDPMSHGTAFQPHTHGFPHLLLPVQGHSVHIPSSSAHQWRLKQKYSCVPAAASA